MKPRTILLGIFILMALQYSSLAYADSPIAACQNLTVADTVYVLTADVVSNATCFNIQANNVTLDCNGSMINYSQVSAGYAVYAQYHNATVKNCRIDQGSAQSDAYAVYLYNSDDSTVHNNSITTHGNRGYGIYIYSSSESNLSGNSITTSGPSGYGIYIELSSANTLNENSIATSGTSGYGIIFSSSSFNKMSNSSITTLGSSGYGIYLYLSDSNNITSCSINASYSGIGDLYLRNADSIVATNTTYSDIYYYDTTSDLWRYWYLDIYVNQTNGSAVQAANVTLWNKTSEEFSELTVNGYIARKTLIEYNQSGAGYYPAANRYANATLYTNYTVNASKYGYNESSRQINLTQSSEIYLTLYKRDVPALSINSPQNATYNYNISLPLNYVVDNYALDNCWYNLNNGPNTTLANCNNATFNASEGFHTLYLSANDTLGNQNNKSISFTVDITPAYSVDNCKALNIANSTYILTGNVNSAATCFNITANSITLDCSGYMINYSQSSAGYAVQSQYNNLTVKNCRIDQGSAQSDAYAVYFYGSGDSSVHNLSIKTYGSRGYGIYIDSSSANVLSGNSISTSGPSGYGIYIDSSSANSLTDNAITTSGPSGYGILLDSSSDNALLGNAITTSNTNGYGIYLYLSDSNNITSCSINASYSGIGDLYLRNADSIVATNTTYSDILYYDNTSDLWRYWYLDVYVNDTDGAAVNNANITAWNVYGNETFSALTTGTGYIARQTVLEYNQSGAGYYPAANKYVNTTLYTNYTINATKSGYQKSSRRLNLTQSSEIYITINEIPVTFSLAFLLTANQKSEPSGFYTTGYYVCIHDSSLANDPTFGIVFAGNRLHYLNASNQRIELSQYQTGNKFIIPITKGSCSVIRGKPVNEFLASPFSSFVPTGKYPLEIVLSYPIDLVGNFSESGSFVIDMEKRLSGGSAQIIIGD